MPLQMPIIKKWLYSDKNIFARELVSNACDAIRKVKILRDQGQTEAKDEEFKIEIHKVPLDFVPADVAERGIDKGNGAQSALFKLLLPMIVEE